MKITHDIIVNSPEGLQDIERENYFKFVRKLPKEYRDKSIWVRWVRTSGIGVSVPIKCEDIEKDITDYETW